MIVDGYSQRCCGGFWVVSREAREREEDTLEDEAGLQSICRAARAWTGVAACSWHSKFRYSVAFGAHRVLSHEQIKRSTNPLAEVAGWAVRVACTRFGYSKRWTCSVTQGVLGVVLSY